MDSVTILDIKKLAEVEELLCNHGFTTPNYYSLGLKLGLSSNTLDIIEADYRGDATRCLLECLKAWLRKKDPTTLAATHQALIKALRKIGEVTVAEGIDRSVHPACCILQRYISDHSIVAALPQLAILLHEEGVVGNITLPQTGEADVLSLEVQDSVCTNYHNLEKFAIVLQKLTSTVAIGTMIRKDYVSKFPANEMHDNKEKTKDYKIPSVDEFAAMRAKFASTVVGACKAMSIIPPDDLKMYLRLGYSYLAPRIDNMHTIDNMLKLVCDQCSVIDLSLLENVAHYFEIEKAITLIEEYKKILQGFKPLRDFIDKVLFSTLQLKSETITLVVDRNVKDYTVNDVSLLLARVFKNLAPHVKIVVIRELNSFIVTCSFPLTLSKQLIATAEGNIEQLKKEGVQKLTIGYCTVYDSKKVDKEAQVEEPKLGLYQVQHDSQKGKLEQLMLSQNIELMNREQELINFQKKDEEERPPGQLKCDESLNQHLVISQTEKSSSAMTSEIKQTKMAELLVEREKELMSKKIDKKAKESELPGTENMKVVPRKASWVQKNQTTFEDDVYVNVPISHPLLMAIVRTRQFNRLKNIRKLGYVYQNIPKATYTRFQQSIGMCFLAGKIVKKLMKRQPDLGITESDVLCVQIAALSYNLGFGPFSYVFNDWFLNEITLSKTHWKHNSSASVMMFQYMIDDNDLPFEDHLDNPEQDIEFIKELMTGVPGPQAEQRKDKIFLYEIVVNKKSGLDVSRIDYTLRDTAVILGKGIRFSWKDFLNNICVETCPDGKKHICATNEDDLEIYNGLFADRHILFKQLYFDRKNRVLAAMVNRILIKCGDVKMILGPNGKRLTLVEATESMETYIHLTDGILDVIKQVDDKEVQDLIHHLERSKLFIPIGKIGQYQGNRHDLKVDIIKYSKVNEGELEVDDIIVDRIKSGYEERAGQSMYYISSNESVQEWTKEWQPLPHDHPAPWRVFLVKRDQVLVDKVKSGLHEVIERFTKDGIVYKDISDTDLTPEDVTVDSTKVSVKLIPEEARADSARASVKSIV